VATEQGIPEGSPSGEAKVLITDWKKEYNQFRLHSSLRYKPAAPEAKKQL